MAKAGAPGLVNFITAVAYHICPSLYRSGGKDDGEVADQIKTQPCYWLLYTPLFL